MTQRLKTTACAQRVAHLDEGGFALTLSLIIIALAAVVVIAFLTTTSTERTTASAYARIGKARQMAEAGVDAAIARLVTEMKYRPYHAIGYRTITGVAGATELIPVITGPRTTDPATPTYNTAPIPTEDVFLISVTADNGNGIPGTASPSGLALADSVDLNANRLPSEPKGWIGSPTTAATPIPYRVPWVNVLSDPTKPVQPDPTQADYNPVIGRYAYWVEDETSKLDISTVGNQDNAQAFQHGDGVNFPNSSPSKLAVNDLDIGALPLANGSPLPQGNTSTNSAILNFRTTVPMLDARFLNRVGGEVASDVHETTKYYATAFSLSNDLAGNGRRRANINALVTSPSNPGSPVPAGTIAGNIDDIDYVISGKHLLNLGFGPAPPSPDNRVFKNAPDNYPNTLVNLGTRFFSAPLPTAAQQTIYLQKLAANIRDYIDTDSQPTIIDSSNTVPSPSSPINSIPTGGASGPNEVIAIGKENVPFLQEYLLRVKQLTFSARTGTSAEYKIEIDHYLEFWNMTNKDISVSDLGPNPFLRIANQFAWKATANSGNPPGDDITEGALRDFSIPLSAFPGLVFRAGVATVLTTDPTALPGSFGVDSSKLFRPSTGTPPDRYRVYEGTTTYKSGSELRITAQTRPTLNSWDYETELILGNDNGIIESFGAPAVNVISVNVDDGTGTGPGSGQDSQKFDTSKYHYRGSSLKGNAAAFSPIASQKGDPRTNNEQLSLSSATSINDDQTPYKNELNSANVPNYVTLTANSQFVDCIQWSDPSQNAANAANAPSTFANVALTSIGVLGNVFDPSRAVGPAPNGSGDVQYSRGGGRTLKVGQPDELAGNTRFSSVWFNAAWRLTDLFAAGPVSNPSLPAQASEMVAAPTSRGKMNINGVLRDSIDSDGNLIRTGGVAFRAALRSFNFLTSPTGDPGLDGRTLTNTEIDSLVSNVQDYLTSNGPIMERGEISQLPFFSTGGMTTVNDRGREEIFRRIIEMITTRSASFTVYAIGEAVRQERAPGGTWRSVPVGQKRLAITFQLEAEVSGASLQNSTIPHAVVDSYRVRRIYAPN
jgi:hypothetical protein